MRATISLLVSSLVFTTLAFNCPAKVNRLSQMLLSSFGSQQLHSLNEPESPILHRGSVRRSVIEKSGANA